MQVIFCIAPKDDQHIYQCLGWTSLVNQNWFQYNLILSTRTDVHGMKIPFISARPGRHVLSMFVKVLLSVPSVNVSSSCEAITFRSSSLSLSSSSWPLLTMGGVSRLRLNVTHSSPDSDSCHSPVSSGSTLLRSAASSSRWMRSCFRRFFSASCSCSLFLAASSRSVSNYRKKIKGLI